ncbi:MAG: hypothetical protein ABEJ56_05010 [Candidatus Nanohaloarchaea archaeon]
MLDGKILAAVLVTLTALSVSTSGGDLQDAKLANGRSMSSGLGISSVAKNPVSALRNALLSPPEPTSSFEAEIQAGELRDETLRLRHASVTPSNLTELELGAGRVDSDIDIKLYGFRGSIRPSNVTRIRGSIAGVTTSGVNLSENARISFETETSLITVEDAFAKSLTFRDARARFVSEGTTTRLRNGSRTVRITGFKGDIQILPGNKTVRLDGKVGKVEAGSFSFGN